MLDLLIIMLERVGTIIAVAFILTRFQFFKNMFAFNQLDNKQHITAMIFFGFFGIIGTYLGVSLHTESFQFNNVRVSLLEEEAIANMRVIGVVVAGLLGGYRVGLGAGLIAGVHRMTLGGFTAFSCGISAIIAAIFAGAFYRKDKHIKPFQAFLICASAEAIQMIIIVVFSKPFEHAFALVEVIGIPMILANGVGGALFILIVQNVMAEQEKIVAQQAQKMLRIAEQTQRYLQTGMNNITAYAVSKILYRELKPRAVAITNTTEILSHIGIGDDHHKEGTPILTEETKKVIQNGKIVIVPQGDLHCNQKECPLGAALIAPLMQSGKPIGTLKLYYQTDKSITTSTIELITGLCSLLSNQLELAETERAFQLAKDAEIKALQAQINPHFLFNALNIIMSLIRTKPEQARQLLRSLSFFLRQNVTGTTEQLVTLERELSYVKAYLEIIEARFVDRLTIIYEIDESLLYEMIPPFTLQPIVENAIQHGINDKKEKCSVKICIRQIERNEYEIQVEDNGVGIAPQRKELIGKQEVTSKTGTGMGLYNVNRRLVMTFGGESGLNVNSVLGEGTTIGFRICRKEDGND